ncbi:MAG: 50S ribosomal protein L23 [Bacteroidetes bacterium]|nr:50S ribosomal protein L23 [Bacteroidota bacterium]MBU1677408.1 50S ribosomal protein L23 [Bacteroidota bacterium]MBU2508301.1 50S ribosomal protein L23 [Bacteroidota bacterium]
MRNVLIRPLITEKMTNITEKENKYGFCVDINANKIEIAKAVEKKFNVDVVAVNTIRHKGKTKTQFTRKGRFSGRTPKSKKAIITIKADQKIDLFGEV